MPDLRFSTDDPSAFTRGDLYLLEGAMLAPDEPGLQTLIALAGHAEDEGDTAPGKWLVRAADLPRRIWHGMLVGYAVCNAMGQPGRPLKDIVGEATTILRNASSGLTSAQRRVSVETFNNAAWPTFKPAAALWAAHMHGRTVANLKTFPCSLADLPLFLGLVEWYVAAGTATKTSSKSSAPLLRLDDCLRPSEALRAVLPAVEREP